MPTDLEFMQRVMPWPGLNGSGYVNLHWTSPKTGHWRGRPFQDPASFMALAAMLAKQASVASGVYYCLTLQSQTGKPFKGVSTAKRSADNAISVKALWLDVDVRSDKGYPTFEAAIDAVQKFVADVKMPNPTAMVFSGGGLHVYWISDQPIPFEEWRPYADGIKSEIARTGLLADNVYDGARVLRVPGTFNRKIPNSPRAVRLANIPLGPDIHFPTALAHLADIGKRAGAQQRSLTAAVKPTFDTSPFDGHKPDPLLAHLDPKADSLMSGLRRESLPLKPDRIIVECPMFRDAAVNHGQGHTQGLWALVLLATTFWEDGNRWAHHMSKGYPSYNPTETDAKYDEKVLYKAEKGLGWPSCQSIENAGSTHCKTCKHRGTIKSPLHLAPSVPTSPLGGWGAAGVVDPAVVAASVATRALHLPSGYVLNGDGIICIRLEYEIDGKTKFEDAPLFLGKITAQWRQKSQSAGALNFIYKVGTHKHEVVVQDGEMALEFTLIQCLARQGCHVSVKNQKHVVGFMKSWVTQIDELYQRSTAAPFGWVYDDGVFQGFSYGGVMYKPDGGEGHCGQADPNLKDVYLPQGKVDTIMKALDMLHGEDHTALEIITLQAWAAPLLHLYGEDACVTWAWSFEGGSHKSTASKIGQALWAAPRRAKENPGASLVGIQVKMGQIRNLPVIIDEIQKPEEIDIAIEQVHYLTEGKGGAKATRNRKVAEVKHWQTIVNCCANGRIHERMVKNNTNTNADVTRVLEIFVEKRPGTVKDTYATGLVNDLNDNFGQLGLAYARQLAMNKDKFKARLLVIADEVEALVFPYQQEERFWKAAVTCTVLAAELANAIIGQPIFRRNKVRDYLIQSYLQNRQFVKTAVHVGGTVDKSETIMADFQREYMNNQLWTLDMNKGSGRPKTLQVLRMPPMNTGKGHPVYLHWCVQDRILQVSRGKLADFITDEMKLPPTTAINSILKHFGGTTVPSKRNLTSGCYHERINPGSPETILEFPVPPGGFFEPGLLAASPTPVVDPLTVAVGDTSEPDPAVDNAQQPTGDTV